MKSFAKITMDSLKKFTGTVQQIVDYSSAASDAMSDFENLISSIDVEIKSLEEKKDQLNDAETVIEDKIAGYEAKIEETQTRIDDLEDDLDRIQSELADTDEYISYDDSEEDWLEQENDDYISLKSQESAVERELSKAENELDDLEQRLDRCRSVNKELSTVLSAVESRITNLSNNKTRVEKNKNEYNSAVVSIRNHSAHAASKLSMIERSLINYMGVRLKINSAFDGVNREVSSKKLDDLPYLSPKFKDALSRGREAGNSSSVGEGKKIVDRIYSQNAAISRLEQRGLNNLDAHERGKYGEMKTDQDMRTKSFERISKEMITDETADLKQGIDGVYYREAGYPQYAIVESKFGASQLRETVRDGMQMSDQWIDNRLDEAVGKDMADRIREEQLLNPDNVVCLEARVNSLGEVTYSKLDSAANILEEGVIL